MAQRVVRQRGKGLTRKREGIEPGREAVAGEGAQEADFRCGVMAEHHAASQKLAQLRPEGGETRGSRQHVCGDAVDAACAPAHGVLAGNVTHPAARLGKEDFDAHDADLHGLVCLAGGGPGGLKVNGGEGKPGKRALPPHTCGPADTYFFLAHERTFFISAQSAS